MSEEHVDKFGVKFRERYQEGKAPELDYLPSSVSYPARIGVIGCGGETGLFLTAYLRAGYEVVALADADASLATSLRDAYFPSARIYDDQRRILDDPGINIVCVCVEAGDGNRIVAECVRAGKNVMMQKHYIHSLDEGEDLARLAADNRVRIAVNMDERWVPAWRYATQVVRGGYIGNITTFTALGIWNHNWISATALNNMRYCILYHFCISWFDFLDAVMGKPALDVYACACRSWSQVARPPLLSEIVVRYSDAKAAISLDGDSPFLLLDRTIILGDRGAVSIEGTDRPELDLCFISDDKVYYPALKGDWLPGGYHGAMAELIKAMEEGREPENGLAGVLGGIALCFAAVASAEHGRPIKPGAPEARRLIT